VSALKGASHIYCCLRCGDRHSYYGLIYFTVWAAKRHHDAGCPARVRDSK
jgi:hypothetical protein